MGPWVPKNRIVSAPGEAQALQIQRFWRLEARKPYKYYDPGLLLFFLTLYRVGVEKKKEGENKYRG